MGKRRRRGVEKRTRMVGEGNEGRMVGDGDEGRMAGEDAVSRNPTSCA